MSKLRNDLINKIKKMPEKRLLFINDAIDSLSEHSKNSVYDSHINACLYCGTVNETIDGINYMRR